MAKKVPSFKAVLTIGVIIGIVVIIIAYFAIQFQQRKTLKASIEGTLPRMEEKSGWQPLMTDREGEHHYIVEKRPGQSGQIASVWDRLTYSDQGKKDYILKRRKNGMFTVGMDKLSRRFILYDLKCSAEPKRYTIMKVFEVSHDNKTLDYGKTGSQKDWEDVPEGTTIDRLAAVSCPQNKQQE